MTQSPMPAGRMQIDKALPARPALVIGVCGCLLLSEEHKSSISSELLHQALEIVAARLDIKWADWSGEAALRQIKRPVLLIGGGKDTLCTTNDLKVLEQAAPPGSKSLLIPEATCRDVPYWFHQIAEPVKTWFDEHLTGLPAGQLEECKTASQ